MIMNIKDIIPFHKPYTDHLADINLSELKQFSGDGPYTKKCQEFMQEKFGIKKALLTTSCTDALEMSAILIDTKPGDEIIMPSYTFVSTANAFALRGATPVFVDIRPDTMNIDENLVEAAITEKTKAIVVVHYAGIACEMDKIMAIAKKHHLYVIEDAAQAVMSKYKGKYLGSIGDLATYSFHETKNFHCGEGGALLINNEKFIERAEIIREKGTNRTQFINGQVDKYTWVDIGSSFLPSEINARILFETFTNIDEIHLRRIKLWNHYLSTFVELKTDQYLELPLPHEHLLHNGHIFFIKLKNINERLTLINYLKDRSIIPTFHYIPLHSSPVGLRLCRFSGLDQFTTKESARILRLPIFHSLLEAEVAYVCKSVNDFFINR